MEDIGHIAGLVAAGIHPSPIPYADVVTTTTHKTLRGTRGAIIMSTKEDRLDRKRVYKEDEKKKTLAARIDSAVFPGLQGGPLDHAIAAKAVAFGEALRPDFKPYQEQIVKNAKAMCSSLQDYGFRIVSGGTDNHLMLVDLRNKNIKGKEAQTILDEAGITANMNMIPYDLTGTPLNPNGIRLGTPAVTTRGMKESEMKQIAEWIAKIIDHPTDASLRSKIKQEVEDLCRQFPLYPDVMV